MTDARVCGECESQVGNILRRLRTGRGVTAAQWLRAPGAGEPGHVLLDAERMTVHPGPAGRHSVVRARPGAIPLPDRSVPALVVAPILGDLPDLDGLFAEFRRVLRPHGLLTTVVPDGPPSSWRTRRLRGRVRSYWRHRSAVDHPDWLLTAADFAVMGDDRVTFHDPDASGNPAAHVDVLCDAGLLPGSLPEDLRADLATRPAVREGRVPLRRLVARR